MSITRIVKNTVKALVALNIGLMVTALIARRLVPSEGDESSDVFVHSTVMFGTEFKSRATALRSAKIFTLFGGAVIDLTGASLDSTAELEIVTIVGGVEVRVPAKWRVEAANSILAGGAEMALDGQTDLGPSAPVLRVRSRTIIGEVSVTNRSRRRTTTSPI